MKILSKLENMKNITITRKNMKIKKKMLKY